MEFPRRSRAPGDVLLGETPFDLLAEARSRLQLFAAASGIVSLVAAAAYSFIPGGLSTIAPSLRLGVTVGFAGYCFIVAWLAREGRVPDRRILDLTMGFQNFGSVVVAVLANARPWSENADLGPPAWSSIAVFSLLVPIVIPTTTQRAIVAALISAAADPIAMLVAVRFFGLPMPSPLAMAMRFGPELLAVPISVTVARIVHRLGERLALATDMGSYHLIERLGEGGMGEVWRATHRTLRRDAAVKLIRSDRLGASSATSARARFEREARAVAELRSPHTVQLNDYGAARDGTLYMVMELIDGRTLEDIVESTGTMPPERVVHVLRQAVHSLREAHARGLVHRDVKPSNVLLARYGGDTDFVKVLDFGLVREVRDDTLRLTQENTIAGTPAYLSPEAATGAPVDARSDLYALGCVAYYLLTGELVFEARSAMEMAVAHAYKTPEPPSARGGVPVPAALEAIVLRLLAKEPDDRFPSAASLDAALAELELDAWTPERADAWWADVPPPARSATDDASTKDAPYAAATKASARPRAVDATATTADARGLQSPARSTDADPDGAA